MLLKAKFTLNITSVICVQLTETCNIGWWQITFPSNMVSFICGSKGMIYTVFEYV